MAISLPVRSSNSFVPPQLSPPRLREQIALTHTHAELTWVCHGRVTIEIGSTRWHLTTRNALWIPAGVTHTVLPQNDSLVFPLQFPQPTITWQSPTAITRTPRLEQLGRVLLQPGLCSPSSRAGAINDICALLPQLAEATACLPMPRDERARCIAELLRSDPSTQHTLDELALSVHTSSKTLQRLFISETQMSFPQWRAQARLEAAVPLLQDGLLVSVVARQVGYSSTSGFISAFRRRFGRTPAQNRTRVD